MKHRCKKGGAPIKWKLLAAFAGFTAVMLALLWLFQVVLLDKFYKAIKTRDIDFAATTIARHLDSADLQSLIEGLATSNELCIMVLNTQGESLASADTLPDCRIHKMRFQELLRLYMLAVNNGGTYRERIIQRPEFNVFISPNWQLQSFHNDEKESIILAQVVPLSDGDERIILLNSTISPVDATVRTLRVQLTIVMVLMILLALSLALVLSRRLAKPLAKVNETAKELAKGNYDIVFSGNGYREVSELNDTLNHTAVELSKVEGLRRELLANISHDLRTPLTMIAGYSEMMRDIPGENTPENVQILIDEASRLTRLVNDLLDLSKLQAGVQTLTCSTLNLTQMVRDTMSRYAKLTEQDGYQIRFEADGDIFVEADETKLSQVLYNLINNAINYTGADKSVTVRQTVQDGWVRMDILDTGEGIPHDKLPYVWERYYKLDKAHKRAAIGTGLGLSIVKNVLELHKAQYGVESAVGEGSDFWFALPVTKTATNESLG